MVKYVQRSKEVDKNTKTIKLYFDYFVVRLRQSPKINCENTQRKYISDNTGNFFFTHLTN